MSSLVTFQIKTRVHTKSENVFVFDEVVFVLGRKVFFVQVGKQIKLKDKIVTSIYLAYFLWVYLFSMCL